MEDKTERYLITKMAELISKWKEPYDRMDKNAMTHNAPIETEYNAYKKMLKEVCNGWK